MGRRVGRRGGSYRGKHVWVRRKARVGCWNSEVPLLRIRIVFWQCCNLSKKASKKLLKKNKNKVDTCCTSPVMGPFPHSLCHMSGKHGQPPQPCKVEAAVHTVEDFCEYVEDFCEKTGRISDGPVASILKTVIGWRVHGHSLWQNRIIFRSHLNTPRHHNNVTC